MNKKKRHFGLIKGIAALLTPRWKLQSKNELLKFRLQLKDEEISDLNNRLEAYKDAIAALSRGFRLEGMLHECDLQKISKPISQNQK